MKKYVKIVIVLFLVLFLGGQDVYAGGGKRNGTAGAQELLIPVGARGLALNGGYVAGIGGVEAIYYNPAGMINSQSGVEVLFSQMSYIADIGVSYAALSTGFGDAGAFGFSIKSINFGDIPVTTVENPQGDGSTFSPTFVTIGVTYANNLTDRIRVGANLKLVSEKIVRVSASGLAIDAGVQYSGFAGIEGLKLGVVLKNFGAQMKFDGPDLLRSAEDATSLRGTQFYKIDAAGFDLPSQLELGVAYEQQLADKLGALFTTTYQDNNFLNDEYKLAAEFTYDNMFYLRGGYAFVPQAAEVEENIFGPTFGAGVMVDSGVKVYFDYAFRYTEFFDSNHMFALKLGF